MSDEELIAECERRGYVCLKKWTEAPTEEGKYVFCVDGVPVWMADMGWLTHDFRGKKKLPRYALGPIKEGL